MLQQDELEKCFVSASNDPSQRHRFYELLIKSDIYFLPHTYQHAFSDQEKIVKTDVETKVTILKIEIDGKLYVPFFTSKEKMLALVSNERMYYKLSSLSFFEMMANANDSELILNPGSEYNKIFYRDEVKKLAKNENPIAIETLKMSVDEKILLALPSECPAELINTLKIYLKKNRKIKKAYLLHIFSKISDQGMHTFLVLDVKNDFDVIATSIGSLLNHIKIPNPPVDIYRLTKNNDDSVFIYCKNVKPFYKKKYWMLF